MIKKFIEKIKEIKPYVWAMIIVGSLLVVTILGFCLREIWDNIGTVIEGGKIVYDWRYLLDPLTYAIGLGKEKKGLDARTEGALENSRFLTDKERDKYFPCYTYDQLKDAKKDGIPVRAYEEKTGIMKVNFLSGAHSLIIGATGSGKTTTFINPMIQILASTSAGSSMIMTDPKGELFSLHSKYLKERGYDVQLLDLRDTYSSSRWNPLGGIYDMYQEYLEAGKEIKAHRDSMLNYPDLKQVDGPAMKCTRI